MIIGIALIGIVAMQVSLLKMNAGIGASIEQAGTLERKNADLRAEVSKLSSEERIQQVAGRLGLVMPHAGDVDFVRTRPRDDGSVAVRTMRSPDEASATATATAPAAQDATAIAQGQPVTPSTPAGSTTTTSPVTPQAQAPAGAEPVAPAAQTAPVTPTPPAQQTTPSPSTGAAVAPAAVPGQ